MDVEDFLSPAEPSGPSEEYKLGWRAAYNQIQARSWCLDAAIKYPGDAMGADSIVSRARVFEAFMSEVTEG